MNKMMIKYLSISLCAALAMGGAGAAFALADDRDGMRNKQNLAQAESRGEMEKDETVYVLAGADGSVRRIIVSDWIRNETGSGLIYDLSDLDDIKNVKGGGSCTINSGGMKVWDARNEDVYYQGNIEKELPVGLSVTYKLDGKPVSAEEIAGRSGKAVIRFDYDNRQYEMVEIDGKKEKIYVPFAVLTGVMLDNGTFHNIEVSNGKLINDGDRTAAVGVAFPGLQENLAFSRDKLEIPGYVEITADVTGFKLGMTVTIAANELFNGLDAGKTVSADDLAGVLGKLTHAMDQLTKGSSALYDGLCALLDKSGEAAEGVNRLAEGAKAIRDGTDFFDGGAARLEGGLSGLSRGLNTISSNNAALNGGAKQVFDMLLSTADTQLAAAGISVPTLTVSNYEQVLNGVIASMDERAVYNRVLAQVAAAVEKNRPHIAKKVTAAFREQVEAQVTALVKAHVAAGVRAAVQEHVTKQVIKAFTGKSKADYDAAAAAGLIPEEQQAAIERAIEERMTADDAQAAINAQTEAKMESSEIKAVIEVNAGERMQSEAVQDAIAEYVELQVRQTIAEEMVSGAVQSMLADASEGVKPLISLKTSLDSYNSFYLGLLSYTDGVASAAAGAAELSSGASELKEGAARLKAGSAALYGGAVQLKEGLPALAEGVTQLQGGSMHLSGGLKRLSEEGTEKLADLAGSGLVNIAARLKATADVSKGYRNFSGISKDMDGKVKFIYRTDEIKAK